MLLGGGVMTREHRGGSFRSATPDAEKTTQGDRRLSVCRVRRAATSPGSKQSRTTAPGSAARLLRPKVQASGMEIRL